MRILIINQPLNNRGDESAHKAFVRTLLRLMPDAYFSVLFVESYSPDGIRQFKVDDPRVAYVNLHPRSEFWRLAEQWINEGSTEGWASDPSMQTFRAFYEAADFVVCAPGGICMGAFQDWWHLFYLRVAQFLEKPLVYYGRSFGPFPVTDARSQRFKDESMALLHYFSFLSIRDQQTEKIAQEIGGLTYSPTTDVAFLERPQVEVPQPVLDAIGNQPYMVFVPNYLLWHPMYKGKVRKETVLQFYSDIIDLITAQEPQLRIVMLPQTFGGGTYETDDVFFFREIAAFKNDPRIIVVPDIYSSDIQQTIIAGARFLIGARYHSVVFALNQDVPFIALNYEHKIKGLLTHLKKTDCMVDIMKAFDGDANRTQALDAIRQLLPAIQSDPQAQTLAATFAFSCIEDFVARLNRMNSAQ